MEVLTCRFTNVYDKLDLELIFTPKMGLVQFNCDSIKILGELIQDLVEYTNTK